MSLKDKLARHKAAKALSNEETQKVTNLTDLLSNDHVDEIIKKGKKDNRFVSLHSDMFYPDPSQPRKTFVEESLNTLQRDIEDIGQLQPILVKPKDKNGKHEIIAGERRWRAIRNSEKVAVIDAVIVGSEFDELKILRMQIQENDNRESVNPLESSLAILRAVELCKKQDLNIDDIKASEMLGVSRTRISKARSILSAPDSVKSLSEKGIINDYNSLYDLSVCHKNDSEKTDKFINEMLDGKEVSSQRKEVKELLNEIKSEKGKEQKETKKENKPKDISKDQKITKIIFDKVGEDSFMEIFLGKKKVRYGLASSVIDDIESFVKDVEEVG